MRDKDQKRQTRSSIPSSVNFIPSYYNNILQTHFALLLPFCLFLFITVYVRACISPQITRKSASRSFFPHSNA